MNDHRRTVVVIPLRARRLAGLLFQIPLTCEGRVSVAVVDQIRAVTKERFLHRIENVSNQQLKGVEDALRTILEL